VALAGAKLLGFKTETEIGQFLLTLERRNFYKSTTNNQNHKEWQDVYHATAPNRKLIYIKFTVKEGVLVLSFKEK
jgi:motility quorum-sensing regulator/GCU-specific mRNA interferase toxin